LFWDDENLSIEKYNQKKKIYFCGRELLKFKESRTLVYQILVLDYDEACYCDVYSDGEMDIKWKLHSEVPHKHRKGGQSAARFSRIRDNEITQWFKRINEYMKKLDGKIYLGMSKIYYNRFLKNLSTYNKEKIKVRMNCEYSGVTGVYQMINKIENNQ